MNAESLFTLALKAEISEIIDSSIGQPVASENNYGDDDGNLYYPLCSDEIIHQRPKFSSPQDDTQEKDFLRQKIHSTIQTMSYDQEQGFNLEEFLGKMGKDPDIYGVLIKDDDRRDYLINPLHPLTALSVKLGQIKLPVKGKLIVYNWDTSFKNQHDINFDDYYNSRYEDVWGQFIKQSVNFIGKKIEQRELNIPKEKYLDDLNKFASLDEIKIFGNIDYSITNSVSEIKALMIPLQMIVDNIATPFYGVSYIDQPTSNPQGYNAGIFNSGNLKDTPHSTGRDVCTGNLPNDLATGWLTLNRINLSSMWNGAICTRDNRQLISQVITSKYIGSQFYNIQTDNTNTTEETE